MKNSLLFTIVLLFSIEVISAGITYPGTNFCGPGRKKGYSAPAKNAVDRVCKQHDNCYRGKREADRGGCDRRFVSRMNRLGNDSSLSRRWRRAAKKMARIIENKMKKRERKKQRSKRRSRKKKR